MKVTELLVNVATIQQNFAPKTPTTFLTEHRAFWCLLVFSVLSISRGMILLSDRFCCRRLMCELQLRKRNCTEP